MKKIKILFLLALIASFTLTSENLSVAEDQSNSSICGDWLCGGTMAAVYVYSGIPEGLTRTSCCTYSDPANACNLTYQADDKCNGWRVNDDFLFIFTS